VVNAGPPAFTVGSVASVVLRQRRGEPLASVPALPPRPRTTPGPRRHM